MLHATRADLEDLRRDRWIASTAAARHRAAQTLLDEQGKRWRRTARPKVKYPDFRPVTASAVQTLSRYLVS